MSLSTGIKTQIGEFQFQGLSLSGIRTSITVPELSIAFDVAQGFPFLVPIKKYFISHGHMDHAAGLPYLISQKAMHSMAPAQVYMPHDLVEPMTEIMKKWEEIEQHQYNYQFHGLIGDGRTEEIEINKKYFIRPFKTVHRITSLGYTLFEKHRKLKPEFHSYTADQLRDLNHSRADIYNYYETPEVTFTGDTQIEFLNSAPWIRNSKILILEATYFDEKKSIEHARKWGHTHLDEIIPELDQISSEKIVLIHLSSRYSDKEATELLKKKIPLKHQDRVVLFGGR